MDEKTIQESLQAQFFDCDLEWKPQTVGYSKNGKPYAQILCYVTARAIQNRLDWVYGVHGWKDEYLFVNGGTICQLSVRHKDEWITKSNGADETDIEAFKGGISSSFKRVAASGFGIGRYLYTLDTVFPDVSETPKYEGWKPAKTKCGKKIWWKIPKINDHIKNKDKDLLENIDIQKTVPNTPAPSTQNKYQPKLASDKQRGYARSLGASKEQLPDDLTSTQASNLIKELTEKKSNKNTSKDTAPATKMTLNEFKLWLQPMNKEQLQNHVPILERIADLDESDVDGANKFYQDKLNTTL